MNRKTVILLAVAIFIGIFSWYSFDQITPEEIENEPDWVPLQMAQERAGEDNRLIVVDIYEIGCKFCRAMHREIYPAPTIRTIIDRDFHPVQVDGNSDDPIVYNGEQITAKEFAQRMGVTAYPFTVILDAEGNILDRNRGYMDVVTFSRFLKESVENRS